MEEEKPGLFKEQIARKPNHYPWADEFIEKMWQTFWTPRAFDFKSDYAQFKTEMTEDEKQLIVRTLSAIGQVEIAVKKFWALLGDNLPHPSMSDLGFTLANTEVIHNKAYEKLLEVLKLNKAFEENLQHPALQGRVNYLRKYLKKTYSNNRKQYVYSIILFTLFVENVSLFTQFYTILHFRKFKNYLKDTAQQVQYTRNEEMIHAQVGIKLINTLRKEYPELFDEELETKIIQEVEEALKAETKIIEWMLGEYQDEYLNLPVLQEFIKDRINQSLKQIKMKSHFKIDKDLLEKTLWFDEETLGNNMTDFFNSHPTDYSKNNKTYNVEELF
jgi:ribonucleoside-diphosphate reductase beta chain